MNGISKTIKQILALTARNIRIFFKDKGLLLTALISPLVILVLYILFLHGVLKDSFMAGISEMGFALDDKLINGYIAAFEISSILAVSGVTVAFIAGTMMVDDKVTGVRNDLLIAPAKRGVIVMGYYLATAAVTLVICYVALIAGFIYIAVMGWELTVGDCFLIILDVLLTTLFGTALSSLLFTFIKSRGATNAVSTIISFAYGFICGAYYPISQFSTGVANLIMCLPGTYFTGLLRSHFLLSYGDAFVESGMPEIYRTATLDSLDANMYFFGNQVPVWAMYVVAVVTVLALVGALVIINVLHKRHRNKVN